jgi:hypothetical protein
MDTQYRCIDISICMWHSEYTVMLQVMGRNCVGVPWYNLYFLSIHTC